MKALILAGGFGTRLRSVLSDIPKPMAPIAGKPFLAYLIDYLALHGIDEVILSVHHFREQIQAFFGSHYQNVRITYAIEEKPLGTGGAIAFALREANITESLFVLNGDTFLKMDYRAMAASHAKASSPITMALRKIPDCSRYGVVTVDNNTVTGFKERGDKNPGLINAGVYYLNPSLFDRENLPEVFSFEKDFLFPLATSIKPQAFIVDDYFIDIGIPEDYARAAKELPLQTK